MSFCYKGHNFKVFNVFVFAPVRKGIQPLLTNELYYFSQRRLALNQLFRTQDSQTEYCVLDIFLILHMFVLFFFRNVNHTIVFKH